MTRIKREDVLVYVKESEGTCHSKLQSVLKEIAENITLKLLFTIFTQLL